MRHLPIIVLAACLIGLGCNSTGKKPTKPASFGKEKADDQSPFWGDASAPRNPNANADEPAREVEGLVAGMLIDSAGRAQANAIVNVTPADAGPNAKPIGIQADPQGYFLIRGLKTGTTYFLSVRGEDGGKTLGGSAITQAPNTRMLIRLTEGGVSSVTPPPQSNSGQTGPDKKDGKTKLDPPTNSIPKPDPIPAPKDPLLETSDSSWSPGKKAPNGKPIPPPPPTSNNPNIVEGPERFVPPPASIQNPYITPMRSEPPPVSNTPAMSAVPSNSSPTIETPARQEAPRVTFTVYDSTGTPVEFRNLSDRRLVVLDFWTTTCMPCLRKVPDLIDLQSRYSNYVDVAGVACDDLPWDKRVKAVDGIKDYYLRRAPRPINYGIYFEGPGQEGRLQSLFKVKSYPTMVLLDHTGRELWRGSDVRQLEESIKYCLKR